MQIIFLMILVIIAIIIALVCILRLYNDNKYGNTGLTTYEYYKNGLIKNLKSGSLEQEYKYDKDLNLSSLDVRT